MRVAITGWGVISPIGIGVDAFTQGVRENVSGLKPITGFTARESFPSEQACTIPDFDVARILGTRKGTRVLDRTAALAVATASMALKDSGITATPGYEERVGVVLGTCNGSTSRLIEFMTETMTSAVPYMVSPEAFPNTVMNFAAGQCAIWNRLRALNTTISGGRLACLLALRYARRMLRFGYADGLLVGGVEEFSEPLAWGSHATAAARGFESPPLGEGCALFTLENPELARKAGRTIKAEILACEVAYNHVSAEDQSRSLMACIRRALKSASLSESDVWAVSSRESGLEDLDAVEERGLQLALESHQPAHRLKVGRLVGECFSASGALQLAGLLSLFSSGGDAQGRVGLVTSLTHGGGVGCILVRGV